MVIRRGDIWWADLDVPVGSETGYFRPVLVVQGDALNQREGLLSVLVAPLTSNTQRRFDSTNAFLPAAATGLMKDSLAVMHGVENIERSRLRSFVHRLDDLAIVDAALLIAFGLDE